MLPIMMESERVSVSTCLAEFLIERPQRFRFILLIMQSCLKPWLHKFYTIKFQTYNF